MTDTDRVLNTKVALVTGASQGIGKGIAVELGACGAKVYVTARTVDRLHATAAEINALGGKGIALPCDHRNDSEVVKVFDEIKARDGTLDILVNNASPDFTEHIGRHLWELPFETMGLCLDVGPRSAMVASALAAKLMIPCKSGLIVNVSSYDEDYLLSVAYGAAKAAIDRIARDLALELREHHVAVVTLRPALVKTENLVAQATTMSDGRLVMQGIDLAWGEWPRFSGRAVAALAADPHVMRHTGGGFTTRALAQAYGFTDVDGSCPPYEQPKEDFIVDKEAAAFWALLTPFTAASLTARGVKGSEAP
ncbi:MAG: SDR family NAD(P)-dependent oxidoreductase [Candidatus Binatia bacterium]